jgi:hypothetical protein
MYAPKIPPPLRDDLLHSWRALAERAARCPAVELDIGHLPPIPPRLAPGHYTSVRRPGSVGWCECAACAAC